MAYRLLISFMNGILRSPDHKKKITEDLDPKQGILFQLKELGFQVAMVCSDHLLQRNVRGKSG